MAKVVAQGRVLVQSADAAEAARHFGFQISQQGIDFYELGSQQRLTALQWGELIHGAGLTPVISGQVALSALPATPAPAFRHLSLSLDTSGSASQLVMALQQTAPFASSPSGHVSFQNLNVVFTQGSSGVTVSGGVELVLFHQPDQPLPLVLQWQGEDLVFTAASPPALPLEQVATLTVETLQVGGARPWEMLQVLYSFEDGSGELVRDSSGLAPIDLTIQTPDRVTWGEGALTTQRDAAIAAAPIDADLPLPAPRPARRLVEACQGTQALSVVLWVTPAETRQSGPARIFTFSKDHEERNFMVGQEGNDYMTRLRTTETDENGRLKQGQQHLLKANNRAKAGEPVCLVMTRSQTADGAAKAQFYLNGDPVDAVNLGGTFDDWGDFELSLGNEFIHNNRYWEGEFHRVAVYSQALTPAQVRQLYYPSVTLTGHLALQGLPAPLDRPLPASIALETDHSTLAVNLTTVDDPVPWLATPQLRFNRIALSWRKQGTGPWTLERQGRLDAILWEQNHLPLAVTTGQDSPAQFLPLKTPRNQAVDLTLEGLGTLPFSNVVLDVGQLNGQPQWQLTADTDLDEVVLPPIAPPDSREFDFKTDFKLRSPQLAIEAVDHPQWGVQGDRMVLQGDWLGQGIVLYGERVAQTFLLRGVAGFELPFSFTTGPIYEPGTSVQVAPQVSICPSPGCRRTLYLDTLVELSGAGFSAVVNGAFIWEDPYGRISGPLQVPQFTTFELPTTPNALLAAATDHLTRHADAVFAPSIKSKADFYVTTLDTQPTLVYGSSDALEPQTTTLPPVLRQDGTINPSGALTLVQGGGVAKLTLALTNVNLEADYRAFMQQLSGLAASPASVALVQRRLAERLPVSIGGGLRYYYSYTDGQHVDLVGGMRLRVEYQNYQFVHPVDKTAQSGFVGSGTAYYSLNFQSDAAGEYLSFDPFLSAVPVAVTTSETVSGLVDLLQPGYRKPFYRLVYPDNFVPASGTVGAERVTVLIGADSLSDLEQATTYYRSPNQATVVPPGDVALAYFRGRATLVPEIAVFVQEQPLHVPVGTTLRQLAERYGQPPLRGRPQRLVHEGASHTPSYRFMHLGDDADALDLPLVQGDRCYF